jgi:hypothetical protein
MGGAFLGRSFRAVGRAAMDVARRQETSHDGRHAITSAPVTKLLKERKSPCAPNLRHHQSQSILDGPPAKD